MLNARDAATAGEILLLDEGVRLRVLQQLAEQGDVAPSRTFSACTLTIAVDDVIDTDVLADHYTLVDVLISCRPEDAAMLCDEDHPVGASIRRAVRSAMPAHTLIRRLTVVEAQVRSVGSAPGATGGISKEAAAGTSVNQGPHSAIDLALVWEHLRFRSKTEIRIAQALDRAGALYLPNCRARLGLPNSRLNKEPDFVVCRAGAWGILEVDGKPFHQVGEWDDARDALFHAAGVSYIRRYDASDCYMRPDEVVAASLSGLATERSSAGHME